MDKKPVGISILSLVLVSFLVFIVVTQILGIPFWWLFRGIFPSSIIPLNSKFDVSVKPEAPINIGDSLVVTVKNVTDQMPVENAQVSVKKDGDLIANYYTDSKGQTTAEYVGEVTIIEVSKDGFDSDIQAIPHAPDKWVRDQYWSIISGIITGVVVSFITYRFQNKPTKRKHKKGR
jgi:hypothetical protein